MTYLEPKELIQARQLIEECKFDEANRLIENFEEGKGHSLHSIILSQFLKCDLLFFRGYHTEVIKLAEQTYKKSLGLGKNILSVDILLVMAHSLTLLFQTDKAYDVIKQGEKLLKSLTFEKPADFKQREARIAFLKGTVNTQKGNIDHAIKQFDLSLSLREELGVKKLIAFSLAGISQLLSLRKGEHDRALNFSKRSLILAEESGNKYCIGVCLYIMTLVFFQKGDLDQSILINERSLVIFNEIDNKNLKAWIFFSQGNNYSLKGELERGIRYYEQSLELFNALSNKRGMAYDFNSLSDNYKMKGELDRALECIERSMALSRETGDLRGLANNHDFLIQILIDKGDLERAWTSLGDLEQLNRQLKDKQMDLMYLGLKASLLTKSLRARDRGKAEEILVQLLKDENLNYEGRCSTLINLCELLLTELRITNDLEVLVELNEYIEQLLEIAEKSNSYWILGETYLLQAKLALLSLNLNKARQLLTQGQQIAERYKIKSLAIKISNEHDEILKQLNTWESLKESNSSLKERMEFARLNEQIENMIQKRVIEAPELIDEDPVLLLVVSEGGIPVFSQSFIEDPSFEDYLFGGFFSAINSFISEKFSEGLDRASFGDHTLLMNSISPFLMCYVYKGQSYLAQQRINYFIDELKNDKAVWETIENFYQINKEFQVKDIPSLESLIKDIFIDKTIQLENQVYS
ncbi:MAG: tetratricopeptide repeat protein [Promethearchaeota archaeon]|jgi:tetratricopeptide (TPR) repeat protein